MIIVPGADRRDRRARPPRAADRDAAGPARPGSIPATAATCSSSRPAPASSRCSQDRAIALVDDAVEASQIDDDRARAQLEAAQAELEAIERGESTADRWQVEQRIKHAENQLAVAGRPPIARRRLRLRCSSGCVRLRPGEL